MSQGDPPEPTLPSTVFTSLAGMAYDSTAKAFKDASNNLHYLWPEQASGGYDVVQWSEAQDTGQNKVRVLIDASSATKLKGGSYNGNVMGFTYKSVDYRLRLVRDVASGEVFAEAVAV